MRKERKKPPEKRETLLEYEFRLKKEAKEILVELKKNEPKKIVYLLKN